METWQSMFISASAGSGAAGSDMNEAGESPLLESVGDSSTSGGSKMGGGTVWPNLKGRSVLSRGHGGS
jgi:hypothetical protein